MLIATRLYECSHSGRGASRVANLSLTQAILPDAVQRFPVTTTWPNVLDGQGQCDTGEPVKVKLDILAVRVCA